MTRTQAILVAVRQELDRRKETTDSAVGLHTVSITIKLEDGAGSGVRGVVWHEERKVLIQTAMPGS